MKKIIHFTSLKVDESFQFQKFILNTSHFLKNNRNLIT